MQEVLHLLHLRRLPEVEWPGRLVAVRILAKLQYWVSTHEETTQSNSTYPSLIVPRQAFADIVVSLVTLNLANICSDTLISDLCGVCGLASWRTKVLKTVLCVIAVSNTYRVNSVNQSSHNERGAYAQTCQLHPCPRASD